MVENSTNGANTPEYRAKDKDMVDTASPADDSIDPENEIIGTRLLIIHTGVTLASFLAGLDSNLMATSVPVITSRFNSIGDVGWYGSSFYIAMCASQPLAGKIYTLFSKKLTFLFYLFIFEIGNLVCALAPSSAALIAGRAVTGLGASGVFVGGIVILATIIPLHKRAIWQGILITMYSVASVIGPIIGGALTQSVSWRWCFYINLPFGALAAVLLGVFLKIRKPEEATKLPLFHKLKGLDLFGFVLLAGSIAMLLLPLQLGGVTYAWSNSRIIGMFVGFGVTLIPFVAWQIYRGDNALVPPRLFGYRNASLLCLCQMFTAGPFQVIIYWLPVWFQAVLGVSPIGSGVRYLPTVIADALTCIIGSGIIMQLGIWNPFLLLAKALVAISGGLLSTIHPHISSGHWIGYQIIGGCGYGLINNVGHIGMQASIPKELVPIGAGSLMAVLSATCAIFLAAGQAIFQDGLTENLSGKVSSDLIARLLDSGATNIRSFISQTDLPVVLDGYSKSISQVFYLPAAAPVIGFLIALGLKWTPLKQTAEAPIVTEKADSESNVESKV